MSTKELFSLRLARHQAEAETHRSSIRLLHKYLLQDLQHNPDNVNGNQLQIRAKELVDLETKLTAELAIIQELEMLKIVAESESK